MNKRMTVFRESPSGWEGASSLEQVKEVRGTTSPTGGHKVYEKDKVIGVAVITAMVEKTHGAIRTMDILEIENRNYRIIAIHDYSKHQELLLEHYS